MVRASRLLALVAVIALIAGLSGVALAQGTPTSDETIPANLAAPEGAALLFALAARGDQIYVCEADPDDASAFVWTFSAPEAELLNERGEVVGSHFAGPTWQGHDGSAIVAAVLERADAPDSGAIPWLLLEATDHAGSGVFSTITHVQRLDTVGGVAPSEGCDEAHAGEEARAPYEATYVFFYPAMGAAAGTATAEQMGAVTVRVFSCPAEMAGQEEPDQAALLAGCTPLDSPETAPTLQNLAGGEPMPGTAAEPGVYSWDGLAFGDYVVGGSGEMPADSSGLLVTDANGAPLQNPVIQLDEASPDGELHEFYFLAEATTATPSA
jgi:hypothetical protein